MTRDDSIQQSNCKDRAYGEDDDEYPVVGSLRVISNEIDEDMGNCEDKGWWGYTEQSNRMGGIIQQWNWSGTTQHHATIKRDNNESLNNYQFDEDLGWYEEEYHAEDWEALHNQLEVNSKLNKD